MSIDWDKELLAPVMACFGEDEHTGLPIYTPRRLPAFALADAVFDAQYERVDVNPDDGSASSARRPVLGVRLSLFPRTPAQNDTVFIPSAATTFVVKNVEQDGHGHALLLLMELKQ